MKILISSCLLGENVKYSGGNNFCENLIKILEKYKVELFPICPEIMGGLSVPREPAEILKDDIVIKSGKSVFKEFQKGAFHSLKKATLNSISVAILKERSPSCGSSFIYDGSFSGKLIEGQGLTTKILRENNIKVFSENDLSEIEELLKNTISCFG